MDEAARKLQTQTYSKLHIPLPLPPPLNPQNTHFKIPNTQDGNLPQRGARPGLPRRGVRLQPPGAYVCVCCFVACDVDGYRNSTSGCHSSSTDQPSPIPTPPTQNTQYSAPASVPPTSAPSASASAASAAARPSPSNTSPPAPNLPTKAAEWAVSCGGASSDARGRRQRGVVVVGCYPLNSRCVRRRRAHLRCCAGCWRRWRCGTGWGRGRMPACP